MNNYKQMFESAISSLAKIDEALGIGEDGCGDLDQTLTAISDLKELAKRGEQLAVCVMMDNGNREV